MTNERDVVANGMCAIYDLLYLVESGHFYEDYDNSMAVLGRAKNGFKAVREALYTDTDLRSLIRKIAPALFDNSEGGGHDLGLWLDSGEITEDEYRILDEAVGR